MGVTQEMDPRQRPHLLVSDAWSALGCISSHGARTHSSACDRSLKANLGFAHRTSPMWTSLDSTCFTGAMLACYPLWPSKVGVCPKHCSWKAYLLPGEWSSPVPASLIWVAWLPPPLGDDIYVNPFIHFHRGLCSCSNYMSLHYCLLLNKDRAILFCCSGGLSKPFPLGWSRPLPDVQQCRSLQVVSSPSSTVYRFAAPWC